MQQKKLAKAEIIKIKKAWETTFVPVGTDAREIDLDQFLWHIFSYEIVRCDVGEHADQAFAEEIKSNIYVFFEHKNTGYLLSDAEQVNRSDLQKFIVDCYSHDIYVTDRALTWTYVQTHEGDLGPYFYKRPI